MGATSGPPPRRGVLPGSFLDLMMQATDKTTGKSFSDFEIANQVCHRGYHEEVLGLALKSCMRIVWRLCG